MDVTEEILRQHAEQRKLFALLDDLDPADTDTLGVVWERLSDLLESHAAAEERYFYPRLLALGVGAPGDDSGPEDETKDAIKDHNEIRHAVARTRGVETGSDAWWSAVRAARTANSDHMGEEEVDDLADFRRNASPDLRHAVAVDFLVFQARHPHGVLASDKDPDAYIEQH